MYGPDDVNRLKVETAKERLARFNPDIEIRSFNQRVQAESASGIFEQFDVILDCLDNLETRLLVNHICLSTRIPLVHGGAIRFNGQLMTIIPFKGPCLRCFSPRNTVACDCERAGIMGPVVGAIGTLQALEAIKYLSGIGESLIGRLLVFDGLRGTFDEVLIERNPECPACGKEL
jgi:adenylyltransferase/sulfurtransferase